jgi:hypothetical protein
MTPIAFLIPLYYGAGANAEFSSHIGWNRNLPLSLTFDCASAIDANCPGNEERSIEGHSGTEKCLFDSNLSG